MDDCIMAKHMSAKVEEMNIGRIESIFCQYSKNMLLSSDRSGRDRES